MNEHDTEPIACTLTEDEERERSEAVHRTLISHYLGADERPDGYTFRFRGVDEAFFAVTRFVASELECCSFANYTIEVTPPYEETHLIVTGAEGTKVMFEALVDLLDAETS